MGHPTTEAVTVVVADADAELRQTMARRLGSSFGRVLEVATAEEALGLCGAHAVDLVAASARLGGMGVVEMCSELRRRAGPPVVAYALGSETVDAARWLGSGGAGCVPGAEPTVVTAHCRAVLRRTLDPRRRGTLLEVP